MAAGPFTPLSQADHDNRQAVLKAASYLEEIKKNPARIAMMPPAVRTDLNNNVHGGCATHVSNPANDPTPAQLQMLNMLDQSVNHLAALGATHPPAATEGAKMHAAYLEVQHSGAVHRVQQAETNLAAASADLVIEIESSIGKVLPPGQKVKDIKKLIKRPFQNQLANVADHLSSTRLMAEQMNAGGTAIEAVALAYDLEKDLNARGMVAEAAALKLAYQRVQANNAAWLATKNEIGKQPLQTAIMLHSVGPTFAPHAVSAVARCQETADELEQVSTEGEATYQAIEAWFYQSLRVDSPNSAARAAVNSGFVPGSADPLVPGLTGNTLEADHIVSMKILTQYDAFQYLTTDEKRSILNEVPNFTGLTRKPNASKGDKTYSTWAHYLDPTHTGVIQVGSMRGQPYDQAKMAALVTQETTLRPVLEAKMNALLIARQAALQAKHQYS